jgi:cytochrome c-type biogenesis protein CcmH/NrfG
MARGAAQTRRKAAKTQESRRPSAARRRPSVEQTMFFPRLRAQAKWVFIFLAFVFAVSFVFFGVGSGSTGLGDILRGNFNILGGGDTTVSSGTKKAQKQTEAHPSDAAAWKALADAYQADGKATKANVALEHYLKLKPNDVDALARVAGYYENRATTKDTEARTLQSQAPVDYATAVGVATTSQLGQLLGQDPVTQQLSQKANAAFADSQSAISKDESFYKRIARLQPTDVNTQYHLAQLADFLGDSKVALKAYRAVVRLAPTDPMATTARQRIAVLALSTRGKK